MKSQDHITSMGWRCVNAAAGLLAPTEREVVLGDLAETDHGVWRGLGDVLGLAARRQVAQWRSWRPWAASFGLALPASLFLMGCSVAASAAFAGLSAEPAQGRSLWLSVSRLFLVICWAWMAGFAVSSISRGTLWASVLASSAPCLHCVSLWPGGGLSFLRLLIFVLPGFWGAWRAQRESRLDPRWSDISGGSSNDCAFHVEQGWMDVWVLAIVARLVPDGNGAAEAGVIREN